MSEAQANEIDEQDCWLYAGQVSSYGYGIVQRDGKRYMAHRVMYENLVGEIPEGLYTDHLCRVRQCINPEHLEPVTNKENVLRGQGLAAQNARKTHCKNGHEFTPDNTMIYRGANRPFMRVCRTCDRVVALRKIRARRAKEKSNAKQS